MSQFGCTKFGQLFDSFLELKFFSLSNMWLFGFIDWLLNGRRDKKGHDKKTAKEINHIQGIMLHKKMKSH